MVFHGLLGTSSFYNCLCLCALFLKNVLLHDNPCICSQECDEVCFENLFEMCKCEKICLEQVPTSIYLLEKRSFLFSFPLDRVILLLVSR